MKLSLYQKLVAMLLVAFVIVVGVLFYAFERLNRVSSLQAEQVLHQQLASLMVQDNPLLNQGKYEKKSLENLFHSMMVLGPNFEFYILDQSGKILTYSAKPGEVKRQFVSLKNIQEFISGTENYPIYAEDPRSEQEKIFSAAPLIRDGQVWGYLYVIIGSQKYESLLAGVEQNRSIWWLVNGALASLGFLLIVLLVAFKLFVRPLRKLAEEVSLLDILQKGRLERISQQQKDPEVEELSQAFNLLIEKANRQMEKLATVDADRRELLAHLSHDLRTPLASLKGYLETIQLRQAQLSPEDLQRYIHRCLTNMHSLKGFVDQIFELAHLESGQVSVSKERFPVADLVYDLADKFSLTAAKKQIQIRVSLEDQTLMVNTDIAKLERIMTNLMENALRHTPNGGVITLATQVDAHQDKVSVIIKDTGSGILQEELPYLFEPRYRGQQAVNDESRHIGLGLTITRKLVKLLGGEIKAGNNPEGGANFTFGISAVS